MRGLRLTGLLLAALCLTGCGYFQSSQETAEDDFPDLDTELAETVPATEIAEETGEKLELKLHVGDRFPLVKTVEQRLVQALPQGPVTSTSRLEMLLAISVEEDRDSRKRLGVRYHQVRYAEDVAGRRIEFDSRSPSGPVPPEAMAYAGLVGNGFSFWIGPENQLIELVGFNDFLQRCVQSVPPEQRQTVLTQLAATSGEDGIANFVDDTIGLLPYGEEGQKPMHVGSSWELKPRQVVRPIPMVVTTQCILKDLSDHTAEISLLGNIAASTTYGPSGQEQHGLKLSVRGGRSLGTCLVDRQSGLPTDSKVERYLEMDVELADGTRFSQTKETLTTIRAFPEQGSPHSPIVPAGYTQHAGGR